MFMAVDSAIVNRVNYISLNFNFSISFNMEADKSEK